MQIPLHIHFLHINHIDRIYPKQTTVKMSRMPHNTFSQKTQASAQYVADLLATHNADLSWQQAFYDDLHEHPELSHQEERTAAAIQAALQRFDVEVTTGIGGHGIVAVMRNQPTEETFTALMRADFDALFVDGKNLHACGHDMHTTALLGALAILDNLRAHNN